MRRLTSVVLSISAALLVVLVVPSVTAAREPSLQNPFGLLPASRQLSDKLVLKTNRVVAGKPIHGTLFVTNRGPKAVNLTRRCKPSFTVALTKNRNVAPDVGFTTECDRAPFLIPRGTTRMRFTVITTAQGCTETAGAVRSSFPQCLPGNVVPPLSAGRYAAVMVGDGIALPAPRPVTVTLTS